MWSVVSSGGVPAGERFDWYADVISREVMPAALSSERPADFQGEAAVLDLGNSVSRGLPSRHCVRGAPPR